MWDLPRPGLEPVSPALAGGFSTTVPPGKPSPQGFKVRCPRERARWKLYHLFYLPSEVIGHHFNHSLYIETVTKTHRDLRQEEINFSGWGSGKVLEGHIRPEIFFQSFLENTVCQGSMLLVSFSSSFSYFSDWFSFSNSLLLR